jgi:hypothetical protein
MYFSLITLSTVGYGDIVPIGQWAMVSANGRSNLFDGDYCQISLFV